MQVLMTWTVGTLYPLGLATAFGRGPTPSGGSGRIGAVFVTEVMGEVVFLARDSPVEGRPRARGRGKGKSAPGGDRAAGQRSRDRQ
jgi:hypothetical protein